jgi:hypothetical protein
MRAIRTRAEELCPFDFQEKTRKGKDRLFINGAARLAKDLSFSALVLERRED